MTQPKMNPTQWKIEQSATSKAGLLADTLIRRLNVSYPIDPLRIAKDEHPRLRAGGRDFGDRFDGKLRYDRKKRCFALMYNSKYDLGFPSGTHHPRTRFSISHELGHYYLEHHHAYLSHEGKSHASINEFRSTNIIEREADSFAASLLLPTHLLKPIVNSGELSVSRLKGIADDFHTSLVSTAIRCVQLSHFPCALVGIRQGAKEWTFPSPALIDAGIYPHRSSLPKDAKQIWAEFQAGAFESSQREGRICEWFNTYDKSSLDRVFVTEEYIPVGSMCTLLVLVTLDENDVCSGETRW